MNCVKYAELGDPLGFWADRMSGGELHNGREHRRSRFGETV